jgi:hypothetical protein
MKRLLIVISALVLVLTFGSAFAGDKDMGAILDNGITVFEHNPAPTVVAGMDKPLENGITLFDIGVAKADEYGASGSAAGGPSAEDRDLWNGVTVFKGSSGDSY